jgi:dienelactone hydrolase
MANDPLTDFVAGSYTDSLSDGGTGLTYSTLTKGDGPVIVVCTEIPGITPKVAEFARMLVDRGYRVVMPSLFGTDGKEPSVPYALKSIGRECIRKEFNTFFLRRNSPAAEWVRSLARHLHEEHGGPGVGVIGMCLTGNFALAAMADESVLAPVLSQPSLPFPLSKKHGRDLGIDDETLVTIRRRVHDDGVCVLGMRFTEDKAVPQGRFDRLREELGDGFIAVDIDSSAGNPHGNAKTAHSVVTEDLVNEPGHPTHDALHQVFEFFDDRLKV